MKNKEENRIIQSTTGSSKANMIKLANNNDISEIMELIKSATRKMNRINIDQWDDIYPNADIIEKDIHTNSLYKFEKDERIAAIVVIDNQGSPEYDEIQWADNSSNYIVVHRLTVHPLYQGNGIAKELMQFCEKIALQNSNTSIRLDSFVSNPIANNLYRRLAYTEKGKVQFRKGSFYCFEKMIKGSE